MVSTGKLLMLAGAALALIGAIVWLLGRSGFRGLPGDVRYEGDNVRFYFPIVTSVVVSILLTLALWLWQWLTRR